MENLVVDASTGRVGVVSMIETARPVLNQKYILRKVEGILDNYSGPKISKCQVKSRITSVAPSEVCEYILDNISGKGWDMWRNASGDVCKQSLRNHVENVRSSGQVVQLQPRGQHVEEQQEQVGTKAYVLQQALRSVNINGSVRIHEDSGQASSIDVIRLLCPDASSEHAAHMFTRALEKDDRVTSIKSRTAYIKINGKGMTTPVTDFNTLVEVIWMLPSGASRAFRRQSAETICRVMGGDLALCRQIEQNNMVWRSAEGGEAIQQALLQPVEYKEDKESNRVKESSVRDALAPIVGGEKEVETPSGFIDVLSDTEVMEVKYYKQWKHALGQVLAYQSYYPRLAKRLHLFAHIGDKHTNKYLELAKSVCGAHAVKVTFEEVVVEESVLDLGDDDASTVVGDTIDTEPREKRARVDNEWDQLAGWGGSKRIAGETGEGRVYRSKQHDEPFWFKHASVEEKRAYASVKVRTSIALGEIDILKQYQEQLESAGRFDELDKDEFAERIRGVQRRFTTAVSSSVMCVAVPVGEASADGP